MIFLACHYYKYKISTDKNIKYKNFILNKINEHFPNEDYLLPYSQYSRLDLMKKLNCEESQIIGSFIEDLPIMISKCDKLVFFPSESLFIGAGMYLEISCAINQSLPIYCYNTLNDTFIQNFKLENSEFFEDPGLKNIFYKKVCIL